MNFFTIEGETLADIYEHVRQLLERKNVAPMDGAVLLQMMSNFVMHMAQTSKPCFCHGCFFNFITEEKEESPAAEVKHLKLIYDQKKEPDQ